MNMKSNLPLVGLCLLVSSASADAATVEPTIRTANGVVRGVVEGDIWSFKGIPFAAPPAGENRWRPPQPLPSWQGVRDASKFGADCAQAGFTPGATSISMSPTSSEDCLYIDDFGQAEPARFAARAFADNGSPVYLYRFSYVQTAMRERLRAGTPHGGEIAFVFGTLGAGGFGPPPPTPTAQDLAVSRMAQSYWVNFARTGDPNGRGLPAWPRYDSSKDLIFDFHPDGSAGAVPDPWKARLDVMQLATESGKRADF